MASLVSVAKGVYVVKPKMEATNAADYVELYTKARQKQLEISIAEAVREAQAAQAKFEAEMELYGKQLEILGDQEKVLMQKLADQQFDIQVWNATKQVDVDKANTAAANKRAELKAERTSGGSVSTRYGTPGEEEGAARGKLTPEEESALKGLRGTGTAGVVTRLKSEAEAGGVLATTTPEKAKRINADATEGLIQEAMASGNLGRDEATRKVMSDLAAISQSGGPGASIADSMTLSWYDTYGPKTPKPTEMQVTGRTVTSPTMRAKYQGLGEAEKVEFTPLDASIIGITEAELEALRKRRSELVAPTMQPVNVMERTAQIRSERFKGPLIEEARKKKEAQPTFGSLEQNPQGYLAIRTVEGKQLAKQPDKLSRLLNTDAGSTAQLIYDANKASSSTPEEAMSKTWKELTGRYSANVSDMQAAHTILIALDQQDKAKLSPSTAMKLNSAADFEKASTAIVTPTALPEMPSTREIPTEE